MDLDLPCQLGHFIGQFWIALFEHIANPYKVVLVIDEHFVHIYLVFGQAFYDPIIEGCPTAIFAQ